MRFAPKAAPRRRWSPPLCEQLGVPHAILTVEWKQKPETAIQERARNARYALLGEWAREQGLEGAAHRPSRRRPGRDLDDAAAPRRGREGPRRHAPRCQGARRATGLASAAARLAPGRARAIVRGRRHRRRSTTRATPTSSSSGCGSARRSPRRTGSIRRRRRAKRDQPGPGRRRAALGDERRNGSARSPMANGQIVYRPTDAPREIRRRIARRAILSLATEGGRAIFAGRRSTRSSRRLRAAARRRCAASCASAASEWRFAKAPPPHGLTRSSPLLRLALLLGPMRLF